MFKVTFMNHDDNGFSSMIFDGYRDDKVSDFITAYRFFNLKNYMKHVYFTFPRAKVLEIREVDSNDFSKRYQKL